MNTATDLRIRKTYLALHNAFTELLDKQRFEDFTVNELCDLAIIRRATFYKHFADKYDYFAFYAKEMVEEFQSQLPPVSQKDAHEYLLSMCHQLLQFMSQHKKMVLNIKNSTVFHILLSILVEQTSHDVIQVLQESDLHRTVNKKQLKNLASFYVGGIINVVLGNLHPDGSPDEELLTSVQSILCGLKSATLEK